MEKGFLRKETILINRHLSMKMLDRQKRVWAQIDLDSIAYNFSKIKPPVCAVVKGNAYGHGAVVVSRLFEQLGCIFLAVSNIEEAIQLRNGGIKSRILVLGYTPSSCVIELANFHIDQCVYSLDYAKELSEKCVSHNVRINIHIKIDTGMGRIGFQFHDDHNELDYALMSCRLNGLVPVGIFTHFAAADERVNNFTNKQAMCFEDAIAYFNSQGINFEFKHCSNSAAIINYPNFHFDMVRAGIILYGVNPTDSIKHDFRPAMSLWSVVSNVKKIKKGDSISYGRAFVADKDMMVATIPIGYADGFYRTNTGSFVYLNNAKCRIIGRICMDQIMVECENAKIGDLVEIIGEHINVEYVANYNKTIPYEIMCSIGERVPRVYISNKQIVDIDDGLIEEK